MRTERRRAAVCALSLAFAAGCVDQIPVAPSAHEIIVHAILDASTRNQYVIVQTTTGAISQQKAVSGAIVTIMSIDGRAMIADEIHDSTWYPVQSGEPRASTIYRISLDKYGVSLVGGATYRLRIVLLDGREVTGATTLPSTAPQTEQPPAQMLDRLRDTLTFAWPRVPGAASYEVVVVSDFSSFTTFADTVVAIPGTARGDLSSAFVAGQTHRVVISAVDANYYDYFRRGSDFFTGTGVISHLQGGIGVFGSMARVAVRTVVVK